MQKCIGRRHKYKILLYRSNAAIIDSPSGNVSSARTIHILYFFLQGTGKMVTRKEKMEVTLDAKEYSFSSSTSQFKQN